MNKPPPLPTYVDDDEAHSMKCVRSGSRNGQKLDHVKPFVLFSKIWMLMFHIERAVLETSEHQTRNTFYMFFCVDRYKSLKTHRKHNLSFSWTKEYFLKSFVNICFIFNSHELINYWSTMIDFWVLYSFLRVNRIVKKLYKKKVQSFIFETFVPFCFISVRSLLDWSTTAKSALICQKRYASIALITSSCADCLLTQQTVKTPEIG